MRICYLKPGNVVAELDEALKTETPIEGGHNHYVYSVVHELRDKADLLLLSYSSNNDTVKRDNVTATTIKTALEEKRYILKCLAGVRLWMALLIQLVSFRPDHVLTGAYIGLLVPAFCYTKLFRKRLHVSFHNDLSKYGGLIRRVRDYIVKRADSAIPHGPFLCGQVVAILGHSSNVYEYECRYTDMRNFTETSSFVDLTEKGRYRLIAYVGRIECDKGALDLFEAARDVLRAYPDYRLVYAGAGGCVDQLKRAIEADRLADRVFLLGKISRRDVACLFRKSWVVVLPTQSKLAEGRPETALEALCMGAPVIAPRYGTFLDIVIDRENGLFYQPDNTADLARKLAEIHDDQLHATLVAGAAADPERRIRPGLVNYGRTVLKSIEACEKRGR
jgi:glycosyltransferase involved in cell wall biosynthesis